MPRDDAGRGDCAEKGREKLVEGRKIAIYFAKSVAKATGQEAKYTKNKGFDDNYYKDLIITYLAQHGKNERAEINELLLTNCPRHCPRNKSI